MSDGLAGELQAALGSDFVIVRELGGGGMSRVFVARDEALGREVVVKVLAPELAAALSTERFAREIRLAAALQDPHIVPVLTAGTTAGQLPFYTMPYVRGASLRQRLTEGALAQGEATRILRDVAQALACAHDFGIVHRDIKPENVLLSDGTAVVTDFGIAKALSASTSEMRGARDALATLTSQGSALGTPAYMAPEQATGDVTDARTDLYAWGVVAYELLAGRHPFADKRTAPQLVAAHLAEAPAPLATRASLPPRLAALVERCLEKHPERRPQSAREVLATLDAITTSPDAAQVKRAPRIRLALIIAGVAVAALVGIVALERARGGAPSGDNVIRSLAVTPFENVGGDSTDAYLAQGIADELAIALGKLPGMRIAPRISAAALKSRQLTATDVARQLGVQGVLAGTVRRGGDRLRVTAELTDARDGRVVWSEQLEEGRDDVFAVEDRITRAIVAALRVRLSGDAPHVVQRGTADAEAHDLYLRGRYFWSLRSESGIARAIGYFQQALARDSDYVRAISGLADAYAVSAWYSYVPPADGYGRAKSLAQRALQLDSTLAEPHSSLGYVALYYDFDRADAERQFQRAIQLDSTYATAHQWYGNYLVATNQPAAAVASLRRAEQADPLNRVTVGAVCWGMYMMRQYRDALAQCRRALDIDSTFAVAWLWRGQAQTMLGDTAAARHDLDAAVRLSNRSGVSVSALAYLDARTNHGAAARALISELTSPRERYIPLYEIALVHAALGEHDEAMRWLERAHAERSHSIAFLRVDPALDPLRGDARLASLIEKVPLR